MVEVASTLPYDPRQNWWRYGSQGSHIDYADGIPSWVPKSEADIIKNYSSAGILPINPDGTKILLGSHRVEYEGHSYDLYGPFAGRKEPGETPLETAIREYTEELNIGESSIDLAGSPMVLVNAVQTNKVGMGVIYPTILSDAMGLQPSSSEISSVRWFHWGELMSELVDNSIQPYWGDIYSWMLITEWMMIHQKVHRKGISDRLGEMLKLFPGVRGMEINRGYPGIYREVKNQT